jgi:hypothetical protein
MKLVTIIYFVAQIMDCDGDFVAASVEDLVCFSLIDFLVMRLKNYY